MNGVSMISPLTIDCIFGNVPRYPKNGEELYASEFKMTLGGGSCVTAYRLNYMNIPVKMGTFLGEGTLSELARYLCKELSFPQIHNLYVGNRDPVVFSSVFSSTEDRGILSYNLGIDEDLLSDDEIYNFLKDSKICIAPKRPEVLKTLSDEGTKIVYDVHLEEGQTVETISSILKYVDFFTPNAKEAMILTKTKTAEEALLVLCDYTNQPIVKIGKNGCLTKIGKDIRYFISPNVDCVDTTGAGDNFLAGLVFGLYKEKTLEESIKLANIAGAYSTEAFGCYDYYYDLNDIEI